MKKAIRFLSRAWSVIDEYAFIALAWMEFWVGVIIENPTTIGMGCFFAIVYYGNKKHSTTTKITGLPEGTTVEVTSESTPPSGQGNTGG